MIGIVYLNNTMKIIHVVPDVQNCTSTEIIGANHRVSGINLSEASFCIVESTELQSGDTLGIYTDLRNNLPPTEKKRLELVEELLLDMMLGGF